MREHNDPGVVSEHANEDATSAENKEHAAAEAAEGAVSETEQETRGFPIVSGDEPKLTPGFRVRKRRADGSWSNHPVRVTDTEQQAEEPRKLRRETPVEPRPEPPRFGKMMPIRRGIVAAVAAVVVAAVGIFSIYVYRYPSVFPGVRVASSFSLSGLSQEEAQAYIAGDCKEDLLENTITVTAEGREFILSVSDVAHEVDSEASAEAAYRVGREGGYFQRMGEVLTAMFGGQNVPLDVTLDENSLSDFVDDVYGEIHYDPTQPSWEVNKKDATLVVDTGKPGLDFDKDTVFQALSERITNINFDGYEIETYSLPQDKPDAAKIAKDVNCEPENAKADTETGEVVDAVTGVEVSEKAIADAIGDGTEQTYTIPVKLTKAELSGSDLEKVLFRDVLAQTTTMYNSGDSGRTTNVSLTAQACDGTILNPGDEFSYNTIVGERTPERGYQKATIFVSGESVEDYGGGACQSSSTIYMAVLRADLKVTERRSHQFQISYTPISQDATVAWGSQDFKFVNDTDYPIKLTMDMGGGSLTCTIYGTKTADKEVSLYSESYTSGEYKYATLYKTVTVNGETKTTVENTSAYRLQEKQQ